MGIPETPLKRRWKAYSKAISTHPDDAAFWRDVIESGQFNADEVGFLYESLKQHDKSRGVFYTPYGLAKKLTDATLGKHLETLHVEIQRHPVQAQSVVNQALDLTILDPACGCGVFLLATFHCLDKFYRQLPANLQLPENIEAHIVARQLYGVDIDATATSISRLLLSQVGGGVHPSVFAGNALVDRAPETPDFCWQDAFGERQWNFVLGNPPYISEVRGQKTLFRQLQQHARLPVAYAAKMDLADWFVALGIQSLKPDGLLGLVLPEYWTHRSAGGAMRQMLGDAGRVLELHTFDNAQFSRAQGHHSSLLVWQKTNPPVTGRQEIVWNDRPGVCWQPKKESPLLYGSRAEMNILEKMSRQAKRIPANHIQQGIVVPQGTLNAANHQKLSQEAKQRYPIGSGIFILNEPEVTALKLNRNERALLKPYFGPGGFTRSGFGQGKLWIIYIGALAKSLLSESTDSYPNLIRHLETFSDINTSSNAPYGLHRPRQPEWFETGERVYCLRQTEQPAFAVIEHSAYVGEGFYIIRPPAGWTSQQLANVLNSDAAWFWFFKHKHKGRRLQIDKDVLCGFPLPESAEAGNPYGLSESEAEILSAALKPL